ncbi:MAG: beta-ureidopropionase / N-carbamoyl-L-amino-acid hydrolase [Solirubrobacteraceae bacterium]|nr:beta-ureidopropionase / N-carbamoyl-L-amino-acid hydrolase [Solirubrobacteraceae bacterium]
MIPASDIAARMADLEPIGLGETGTNRLAWTAEDAEAARWFETQAADVGLRVERDPAGNLWACPAAPSPWWGVGSHLDSVRDGGRFDGALGVAAGFEVAARARAPVAVISFADEEGARFNTPTFGSRALVGRLDVADVLARVDDDGVTLADAMRAAGVDPAGLAAAPRALERLKGFVELHIDQTRDVARAGAAVGTVARLASRLRLAARLTGRADHSGTTRREERRDALAAAARLIVAADELAGADPDFLVTATRMLIEPNALTTVPAHVALWLDARAPAPADLAAWRSRLADAAERLQRDSGVSVAIEVASESPGVVFHPEVADSLRHAAAALGHDAPEVTCYAGHDAGILAERVPAGMVLVCNETGVSHSADEHVELEDAARAADVMAAAVEALA